ncbi:MAG: hypothetical protein ACLQDQ_12710 [Myxococcaceae bacterium]
MGGDERRNSLDEAVARIRQTMDRGWEGPLAPGMADPREWKDAWREQRRVARAQWRQRRRRGSKLRGAIFLGVAAVLTYLVVDGGPFWMMWVALGFTLSGLGQVFRDSAPADVVDGQARPVQQAAQDPANLARVDALCDKLLEEIRKGPAVLREVVRNPEQSVRGLRDTVHELAKREAELRALVTSADGERLQRERVDVVARRDAATDALTHERWEGALKALDAQLQHRETLRTQGARLEAERVRLGYTLENLYTQVLAVRSTAGSDAAGTQLKAGVEQLGDEISAVADALESMQSVDAGATGSEQPNPAQTPRTRV